MANYGYGNPPLNRTLTPFYMVLWKSPISPKDIIIYSSCFILSSMGRNLTYSCSLLSTNRPSCQMKWSCAINVWCNAWMLVQSEGSTLTQPVKCNLSAITSLRVCREHCTDTAAQHCCNADQSARLVKCGRQIMCKRPVSAVECWRLSQADWTLACKSLTVQSEIIAVYAHFNEQQQTHRPLSDPSDTHRTYLQNKTTSCWLSFRIFLMNRTWVWQPGDCYTMQFAQIKTMYLCPLCTQLQYFKACMLTVRRHDTTYRNNILWKIHPSRKIQWNVFE